MRRSYNGYLPGTYGDFVKRARKNSMKTDKSIRVPAPQPELTPAMQTVISSLLSGANISAACIDAGINRDTYYRWVDHFPLFVAELNRQRAESVAAIRSSVQHLAVSALSTLREVLLNEKAPAGARVRAATVILNHLDRPESRDRSPQTVDEVLKRQVYGFIKGMMAD